VSALTRKPRLTNTPESLEHAAASGAGLAETLPDVAPGTEWKGPDLPNRAYGRLEELYRRPADLAGVSMECLLNIEGFGSKPLRELFAGVETPGQSPGPDVATPTSANAGRQTMRLAQSLSDDPAAASIGAGDVRFGAMIRRLDPEARDVKAMARGLLAAPRSGRASGAIAAQVAALHRAIQGAKRLILEAELAEFLALTKSARDRAIFARVQGWDGRGGSTLKVAGSEFGITRERVRQICAAQRELLSGCHFAPALDAALALIASRPGGSKTQMEDALLSEGLIGRPFRLEGILNAAEVFGRRPAFSLQSFCGQLFATTKASAGLPNAVFKFAQRAVRHRGAAKISDVSSQTQKDVRGLVKDAMVRDIVQTRQDFRWLDEDEGWFWLSALPHNLVVARIRKVLCVAPAISVAEMIRAISRDRRLPKFALPNAILLELCTQLPWCRVTGQGLEATAALDPAATLRGAEAVLFDILRSHGGPLSGEQLETLCLAAGIGQHNFLHLVSTSPILRRYAPRVYGPVGARFAPEDLEHATPRLRSNKPAESRVLQSFGWLSERTVWICFRLSDSMIRKGIFSIPAGVRRAVEGRYDLMTPDGIGMGKVSAKAANGWGLSPLYARSSVAPGDYLVLLFDRLGRSVTAKTGGAELLEEYPADRFFESDTAIGPD
jgi:hypothetical protein